MDVQFRNINDTRYLITSAPVGPWFIMGHDNIKLTLDIDQALPNFYYECSSTLDEHEVLQRIRTHLAPGNNKKFRLFFVADSDDGVAYDWVLALDRLDTVADHEACALYADVVIPHAVPITELVARIAKEPEFLKFDAKYAYVPAHNRHIVSLTDKSD